MTATRRSGGGAVGQLAELLDQPAALGAEQVLDEDALVADLVHGGTEDRCRVAGPEPDADRLEPLEAVERLERPALHLRPADPDRPVGQPDDVDARVGHEVVGHVGVDDPGQGEPVPRSSATATARNQGAGAPARPSRHRSNRRGPWDEAGGPAPSRRWSVVGPPASCPCNTSPPATQGVRRAPIRADMRPGAAHA